jgi:LPXTG-motif cell wall-anchored protein
MKNKQIISLVVSLLGVILIIYALHSMGRISHAKSEVSSVSRRISGSTIGRMVGGEMQNRASQYDTEVRILLIGGIILAAAGGYFAYRFRKR